MKGFQNRTRFLFFLCLLLLLPACLPNKKLTVGATATLLEEVARASSRQSDLRILREGMPAYLMLIDGMIQAVPDNEQLLIAAAQSYSSFASLFVEDQDKEYANLLYGRGKQYALKSLEMRGLMKRALELDEGFYYGGPHLFMGIWFASRPKIAGGNLKKAQEHFLKAFDLGQGKFLMAYVYYANYYARKMMDKDLFISTLQKVLEIPDETSSDLVLLNTVAKRQAKELLSRVEEYFE